MESQLKPSAAAAAIDPVCGMSVDPAKAAATREHGGKKFYFCCNHCAEKFSASPEQYLQRKPAGTGFVQLGGMAKPQGHGLATISLASDLRRSVSTADKNSELGPPLIPSATGTKFICPMDPEVVSDRPGSCPKCGMAMESEILSGARTEYFCPMDPEVVAAAAGSCPKCGMALEPRFT